jgi:hypothetical protein
MQPLDRDQNIASKRQCCFVSGILIAAFDLFPRSFISSDGPWFSVAIAGDGGKSSEYQRYRIRGLKTHVLGPGKIFRGEDKFWALK